MVVVVVSVVVGLRINSCSVVVGVVAVLLVAVVVTVVVVEVDLRTVLLRQVDSNCSSEKHRPHS